MTGTASLEQALDSHVSGDLERAESLYREILRADPSATQAHLKLGSVLQETGRLVESVDNLREVMRLEPGCAEAYHRLGTVLAALDEPEGSLACFQTVVQLRPTDIAAHFALGNTLATHARFDEAIAVYQQALAIDPAAPDVLNHLGMVYVHCERYQDAVITFRQALEFAPSDPRTHANLGHTLRELDSNEEAIACFRRALSFDSENATTHYALGRACAAVGRLEESAEAFRSALSLTPSDARTHYYLGNVLKDLEQFDDAAASYLCAIEINPQLSRAHYDLGNTYKHQLRYDKARACYEQVLTLKPDDPAALVCLGNVLKSLDELEAAAAAYRRVLRNQPDRQAWELWISSLCPSVCFSADEIDSYRERLRCDLERISAEGLRMSAAEVDGMGCPAPYNLQFHGRDERPLKQAYANVFGDWNSQEPPKVGTGKPRVGFVVTSGHEGVFVRYLGGVIERMDPSRFEFSIVCSHNGKARINEMMETSNVEFLEIPHRFGFAAETIREARFDLLYYWEVGSDVLNYFLPFLRLAPVQCTSGGLPVTSGIPTMDYFLSSELAEPEFADEHYSETLIRATSQLSYQRRMPRPQVAKTRADFGFAESQHLYVCAQKIQKFHPDFDRLMAEILRRDQFGLVVIPEDPHGYASRKLRSRMMSALPDVIDRVAFLPRLSLDDYFSLLDVADVLLDPLHYGGGLTAYDGFSLNKPIVTLPGEFVRGRYTYACYRRMGLTSCVAKTGKQYVEIALQLGTDPAVRAEAEAQLEEATSVLFEDQQAIRDYEEIFSELIETARCKS